MLRNLFTLIYFRLSIHESIYQRQNNAELNFQSVPKSNFSVLFPNSVGGSQSSVGTGSVWESIQSTAESYLNKFNLREPFKQEGGRQNTKHALFHKRCLYGI